MKMVRGSKCSSPVPTPWKRKRAGEPKVSYLFLQTACQDTDEEEDEDQVRAMNANCGPGVLGLGLWEPWLLKDW